MLDMGKVRLETKQKSVDQLLHTIKIAHEYSCQSHSMNSEETLNLQIKSSQPTEETNRIDNMQDNLDLTTVKTPSTKETDFGVTTSVVGGENTIYHDLLSNGHRATSPGDESLLSPDIITSVILDPFAEATNDESGVPANVSQNMQHSISLDEPLNLKEDMESACKGTTSENKMATITRKRSERCHSRNEVQSSKTAKRPYKEKMNETAESINKEERQCKETDGNEVGISAKERMLEAKRSTGETMKNGNKNSETVKIRSINVNINNINKEGKAPNELAVVSMEDNILKIESPHKEQSIKRGRGRPPKERITQNMVDEDNLFVKESSTSRRSARKQSRPTQVRKIMDNKTSLKVVRQRNKDLSVVPNKRLPTDQTDDVKLGKKKSAKAIYQTETETPESLKYVLTTQFENETQLNEEENQEDFFIQSTSQVKTVNGRVEFDCELDGDEPQDDASNLNVENQVVKLLDFAPMKTKVPFVKSSPLWGALESSDLFSAMPQQPHFLPLKQYSESYREGMAIGLTVTFTTLVDKMMNLSISDPDEFIEQNMETLVDLERHGFNLYNLPDMLERIRILKEDHKRIVDDIYATNELKTDAQNKEDLLNEKLEAVRKTIMELELTKKSLTDEKLSLLEQVEGLDSEIVKLQIDKKTIEKSFLAAKNSLDCARRNTR